MLSAMPTRASRGPARTVPARVRSPPIDGRDHHRRLRDRVSPRFHLHPRRIPLSDRYNGPRSWKRPTRAAFWERTFSASAFDFNFARIPGAGAYECGEETALLNSLEGLRGYPRIKPPFPAVVGLYEGPTVINNVETLANVPAYYSEWRGVVRQAGHAQERRHAPVLPERPHFEAGCLRIAHGLPSPPHDRRGGRRGAGRQEAEGHYSRWLVLPGAEGGRN